MKNDLKLTIDASAARRGSREFVGAIASIKQAMTGLSRDTDGLFKKLNATTKAAAPRNVKAQFTAINSAVRSAESSVGTLQRQLNKIGNAAGLKRVDSAMEQFRRETSATTLTTAELAAAKDRLAASLHEVRQGVREATEIQRLRTQFQRTSAALDPLTTGTHAYRRAQLATEQALRSGAISQTQAIKTINAAKTAYTGAGAAAANAAAQQSRLFGTRAGWGQNFDARQVMMQLSQVGQQGAVTGNYLQALAIQLPDLALGFGPVGIAAGAVAGVLGSTLIGMLGKTKDEAKELENQVHALSTALDGLKQYSAASAAQIEAHLKSAFGSVAGDVQALIEDLRAAEFSVISHKMRKEVEASTKQLTSLSGAFEIFWADFMNPGSVDSGYLNQMTEIIGKAQMSYPEFTKLEKAVNSIFTSQDVNEFVEHLSHARTIAAEIGGPVGDQIAKALLQAAKDGGVLNRVTGDAASSANSLTTELSEGARKVLELAEVDIASGISDGTKAAAELAHNLGISLTAAYNLKNLQDSKVYGGRGQDPRKFGNGYTPPGLDKVRTGGAAQMSDLARTTQQLEAQSIALKALQSGLFETSIAADAYAQAMIAGGGAVDKATMAALKQADAVAHANEQLRKIVQTNQSGGLQEATEKGIKGGLKSGLQAAMQGDAAGFARALGDSVFNSVSNALSDALVESLFAKNAAGNAGNIFSTILGFFGAGSEGGYSEALPGKQAMPLAAFKNAPHYAEGTANTSNGIPSILHPNEAVVPLSRGRKIPVEMGGGGKSVTIGDINTSVTVEGGDDSPENAARIGETVRESIEGMIDTRIAENAQYGGALNPRGGM